MTGRASQPWFSAEDLEAMARPTMDRALEAIQQGDLDRATQLCNEMRHEWRGLHDTMAGMVAGLVSYIQGTLGEEAIADAWTDALERSWREDAERAWEADRKRVVRGLAATWRAHSGSGTGDNPGAFTITEDDEKFTFTMNPCGSGQRLWLNGAYRGDNAFAVTERAHSWTFGQANFPAYCTHCAFMNDILPIKWYGMPLFPADPPTDFDHDPCTWYWYKDPAAIPDRFWHRYGLQRPAAGNGSSC